ncbi:MAG: hypothetical protein M3319_00730 [Actinomycetota bacterium]|nr:hypothetical protein [Actinomycetota bacterium]
MTKTTTIDNHVVLAARMAGVLTASVLTDAHIHGDGGHRVSFALDMALQATVGGGLAALFRTPT